jgi:hypothetical protein
MTSPTSHPLSGSLSTTTVYEFFILAFGQDSIILLNAGLTDFSLVKQNNISV